MRLILLVILTLTISAGQAQSTLFKPNSVKESFLTHSKNNWLVGGGGTYLGVTAKGGRFLANRWWVGTEAEIHNFLTTRQEIGLFTRYYTGIRRVNGFVGTGLSYGQFQGKKVRSDEPAEALLINHRSLKVSILTGLEVRLTKRISIEGVAKVGRLTKFDWTQPSFQGSVNYYLGR